MNEYGACVQTQFDADPGAEPDPDPYGGGAGKYLVNTVSAGAGAQPPDPPNQGLGFAAIPAGPGPQPVDYGVLMGQLTSGLPLCGYFYQVRSGDRLNEITKSALQNTILLRAQQLGASAADANQIANAAANQFFQKYREAIMCSPWNDALYSEWAYPEGTLAGPAGRAYRMRPKHFDNLARMTAGEAPARNVRWGSPDDPKPPRRSSRNPIYTGDPSVQNYALLWLPGIGPGALRVNAGTDRIEVGTLAFPLYDNSAWSQVVPPPAILDLGIIDENEEVSQPATVGCREFAEEY